ncbi:MAG: hypothetical protein K8R64_02885 [Methanosarcinaceae archaeon]|nr:hypothetical protein [Methanosarcinaceae archaeon]
MIDSNDREVVPVEIKYRNNPTGIKGIEKFMSIFEIETRVVITKDVFNPNLTVFTLF